MINILILPLIFAVLDPEPNANHLTAKPIEILSTVDISDAETVLTSNISARNNGEGVFIGPILSSITSGIP